MKGTLRQGRNALKHSTTTGTSVRNSSSRTASLVLWLGITRDVTSLVQNCGTCQAHQRKQPLCHPWQMLSSDLFEFKGNQYLLIFEKFSKFPIIRKLISTTSRAIINHLNSIFAEHGIPEQLTTGNGLQYASGELRNFMQAYGVEHLPSSLMYPQYNGSAEPMV